jgi:hypothetical protein
MSDQNHAPTAVPRERTPVPIEYEAGRQFIKTGHIHFIPSC